MIRRLFLAVWFGCAVLLTASCGTAGAEVPSGGVYVTTLPSGADIWIDGTYVGRSPVLVDALARGHHAITITKAGWNVQELDVQVPAGAVAMSSTHLIAGPRAMAGKAAGTVIFHGNVSGAFWLDGEAVDGDIHRSMSLLAGTHRLAYTTAGGRTSQSFVVYPDTTTQVVLREPHVTGDTRSGVVAPAEDYLADGTISVDGKRIVVRYARHYVVAYLGDTAVHYDGSVESYLAAPELIDGKLYLPLELLEKLTADTSNKK